MDKIDVAIVVERFHSRGGVEGRTSELVRGLLSAGHQVHVYAHSWDRKAVQGSKNLVLHRVPMLRLGRALKPLSFAWFCSLLVRRSKHDLVHAQTRVFSFDVATLGVGCHRAYLEATGVVPRRGPDAWFHSAVLHIERAMLRPGNYRFIIVNSGKCGREFATYYGVPQERIAVVHNGVDSDRFSPAVRGRLREQARRELGLMPGDVAVLYVGTGFERKGLDTLVQAVACIRNARQSPRLKLVVVGRGDLGRFVESTAGRRVEEWLVPAGWSDDVAGYYAAADIFALPTRYDPFANSTMEALASGLPVVTTRSNGVSEILRDGTDAFITEANEPNCLADRLRLLAMDVGLREQMGANGRRAVEPFTWKRTADGTMAVYETVLAAKRAA